MADTKVSSDLADAGVWLRGELDGLGFEFWCEHKLLFFGHDQTPARSLIFWLTKSYQAQVDADVRCVRTLERSALEALEGGGDFEAEVVHLSSLHVGHRA